MHKTLIPLALAASLAATGAFAASSTGTIAAITPATARVTLDDGAVYSFPDHGAVAARLANFKVGDHVTIQWIVDGTAMDVTAISPAA